MDFGVCQGNLGGLGWDFDKSVAVITVVTANLRGVGYGGDFEASLLEEARRTIKKPLFFSERCESVFKAV